MDLNQIVTSQIAMDELHGFPVSFDSQQEKYRQLTKDLVGCFGEIGELANLVKKVNIKLDHPSEYVLSVSDVETQMREELVDSLIYIIRLGAILGVDLESELLKKMQLNADRYERLRQK